MGRRAASPRANSDAVPWARDQTWSAIIIDGGRRPMWAGDLITDGRGTVYMVGRWHVTDEDMKVFGMVRHKMQMAVFFSVIDVSKDLPDADIHSAE